MENLLDNLKILLQKDERLISEGELLKNKIIELAIKLDKDLIKLLLADKQMKEVFFTEAGKATIFDKDKFIRFVSNKQFLPDSYTAFKNKIGLTEDKEFIKEKKEVVLSWPYKDCVLEGGMTKENQKRDEIFWNEILAPDEISRLLDPKVFTNAKRIDKKGPASAKATAGKEHKFDGFRTDACPVGSRSDSFGENGNIKDNLIIKGNNLLALHSLKKRFAGKIKLIYIDPPYNTGGDSFRYNDKFNHSSWLTFMRNRLECAKELLATDGSIYLQLDWHEVHYCKVLMDEIFGRDNFRNEIIWNYVSGGISERFFARKHDTVLFYSKTDRYIFKPQKERKKEYDSSKIQKDVKGEFVWYIRPGTNPKVPRGVKSYIDKYVQDVWEIPIVNPQAYERLDLEGQKPEKLLARIIETSSNSGDLIVDFFAGTGTTGAVAHKLGRQYILVEQIEDQLKILQKRLKKVISGDQTGISKSVGWKGGGDFVYLELMKWNENFVEQIKKAKSGKELQKLCETMKKKAFLSYKVDIKAVDENAKDFVDLSIEDQKRFLLQCLDKNHLYVNYSEIDDEEYGVSVKDKRLNREFYDNR